MLVNIANAQIENGAEVHVCIIKPQPYIVEHMADYDLLVQPSRWEGFGLTVAEAMAAKVLVSVSEGQGPAEVTCGYFYGWIFDLYKLNQNRLGAILYKVIVANHTNHWRAAA